MAHSRRFQEQAEKTTKVLVNVAKALIKYRSLLLMYHVMIVLTENLVKAHFRLVYKNNYSKYIYKKLE